MNKKVYVQLNKGNVKKNILQADFMLEEVEKTAKSLASAGDEVKVFIGHLRAKALIYNSERQ